jgi:hypothetical protein
MTNDELKIEIAAADARKCPAEVDLPKPGLSLAIGPRFIRLVVSTIAGVRDALSARADALDARILALEQRPAAPRYVGVHEDNRTYEAGDIVTLGGSMWIAKERTFAKPDEHTDGARTWTLCVKRGREGRPGKDGKPS